MHTEAIESEVFEPRIIEFHKNLGTDPYQTQERSMGENYPNPIAEDMDEFGKVGIEMSSHRCVPITTQRKALRLGS